MFIKNKDVADWKDLQNKVAQLFQELGFQIKTPHEVELAGRGKKEVDVFAEDKRASSSTIYVIECKWWDTEVPRDVVHAFHTVVQGCGANTGFIISKKGFQKGAKEAVQFTNIGLLTFEGLQEKFGDEWFRIRRSEVSKLEAVLREVHRLYFDQFNTLPLSNNMIFHTPELGQRLAELAKWNSNLLCECNPRWPESYRGPEPVKMATNPLAPFAEPAQGADWHEAATVREFFKVLVDGLKNWIQEFETLQQLARKSFESLPEEEQAQLQLQSLQSHLEELPIRVLKRKLPVEEYDKLLKLVTEDMASTITSSGAA